jgi:hypothetical protein
MRFAVTIVAPPNYPHVAAFFEVAESLRSGLVALGHEAVITTRGELPGHQHIVLGSNLLVDYPLPIAKDAILYNLEQIDMGSAWMKPGLIELFKRYRVWDYSRRNVAALKALGVRVEQVLPVGYAPELTRIQHAAKKDIDVLFVGSMSPRRQAIIDGFHNAGANVSAVFGAYGGKRDAFIARAKLVVNVHYYDAKVLEIVRLQYLLANRVAVLSERGADPSEDAEVSDGVAFAPYEKLVAEGLRLLASAQDRAALAEKGFATIRARSVADYLRAAL